MSASEDVDIPEERVALTLEGEEASRILAEDVAIVLRTGDMLALSGDLGAGKTTFARALVRYLADDDALEVPSPTYTLVQSYETRPKTTHFDLYRIGGEDELEELGFQEAAETGVVMVEWPERSSLVLAEANLHLRLGGEEPNARDAELLVTPEASRRLSRSLEKRRFLRRAGHPLSRRRSFPADASQRVYEHVLPPEGTRLVLMDAPQMSAVTPATRHYMQTAHIADGVLPFVAIAAALKSRGFTAPAIVASDVPARLVLMEYLGDEGIVSSDGEPIAERYEAAACCLAELHAAPFSREIAAGDGTPYRVPEFDRPALRIEVELLLDWAFPRLAGRRAGEAERTAFARAWETAFDAIAGAETSLLLRDFHSPNILWLAEREGCERIGLLDFQDAMIGPAAYDLASLAQDARVDIAPAFEEALLSAYSAVRHEKGGFDEEAFRTAYAVMAAQRATKILGGFVRSHERDGKPQYLRHLPRIKAYLKRSLRHPVLAGVGELYEEWGILQDE